MKLIIRDEKLEKEETCEMWLEEHDGRIRIMSQFTDGLAGPEVVFSPDGSARPIKDGYFKWETE